MKRTKLKKYVFLTILFGFIGVPLDALGAPLPPYSIAIDGIFSTPKDADSYIDGETIVVTENKANQIGSIFSTPNNKIDLTKDFHTEMYIYMEGLGDGLTFVMHNDEAKAKKFAGFAGGPLGAYANYYWMSSLGPYFDGYQLLNSFAVEFDTYLDNNNIKGVQDLSVNPNLHAGHGHVAYLFPNDHTYYGVNQYGAETKHAMLQYPSYNLGDGQWRLFKVDWEKLDVKGNGVLTYHFEGLEPVKVPINKAVFNSDSVYWGFTGSTKFATEEARISFKSISDLVDYSENIEFLDSEGKLITSKVKQGVELTAHYTGNYNGGRQNMLNSLLQFNLSENQEYQDGSFMVNGKEMTPTIDGERLTLELPDDLGVLNPTLDVSFKVKTFGLKTDAKVETKASISSQNYISEGVAASYDVLADSEPPVGKGKVTFIAQGDTEALADHSDVKSLLAEYSDDVTPKDKIKVVLKTGQDFEKIVSTVGISNVIVTLTDEVNNSTDVSVPLFIKNEDTAISDKSIVVASNVSINATQYPKTTAALQECIKKQGNIQVFDYDLTTITLGDKALIKLDLTELPKPPAEVSYKYNLPVTIEYHGQQVHQIAVDILPEYTTVTINFIDENGVEIVKPVILTEQLIYSTIDLTTISEVQDKVKKVKAENYAVDAVPANEKKLYIAAEDVSTAYKFKGTLFIESAPTEINFGNERVSAQNKIFNNPSYDQPLIIWDNRADLSSWRIKLKHSGDLSIQGDNANALLNALSYQTSTDEKIISTEAQEVFRSEHKEPGKYDVSGSTWGPEKQGLRLNVPVGSVKKVGKYETTLTWQIEEAY